jgi:RNA polymerase sigma-70 factor (ECF subfamily)
VDDGAERRAALGAVLETDGDRLYRLALRVTRDPDLARDAVQEAFTSALAALPRFRGEARLGTWLHRIVYTKSIDLLRQRRREEPLEDDGNALTAADALAAQAPFWTRPPDEQLASAETDEALKAALETLTPLQRAVFGLRELEGKSTEETAESLGLSAGAVRIHLHRARLRLRARLSEHLQGASAP